MPEEIHTGGLKKFVRGKEKLDIEPELGKAIEEGYEKAEKRKRRNRIIKLILTVLIILLILVLISTFK